MVPTLGKAVYSMDFTNSIVISSKIPMVSLVAQLVKNLPAMQEALVQFLGWEDPLEKGKAIDSSILGFLQWLRWEKIHLQCRRPGFNPWLGKIPWRRAWQPTPVFLPGQSPWTEEPGGLQSMGSQRVGHNWETKQKHQNTLMDTPRNIG